MKGWIINVLFVFIFLGILVWLYSRAKYGRESVMMSNEETLRNKWGEPVIFPPLKLIDTSLQPALATLYVNIMMPVEMTVEQLNYRIPDLCWLYNRHVREVDIYIANTKYISGFNDERWIRISTDDLAGLLFPLDI